MTQPNILLITTDQQRFDTIAALGNNRIYTPHLDWLADEGTAFTRAYSACPICMPARATIMTGRTAANHGLLGNSEEVRPLAGRPTLPGVLTRAGYQTRAQGKMHFAPMRANYGFEHMELSMDYYRDQGRRRNGRPAKAHGVGENEMTPVISTVHEADSITHWTVERSIDFLETRDTTRPFFLWTSFTKPHPPFDPCADYWALYADRPVPEPACGDWSQTAADVPQGFMASTYRLNSAWRSSCEQLADARRAYYACITQIDYSLGLLFARMREMGLFENTWIIFTSDHGEMLGDHHMGAKSVHLEGASHVPLIVRPPSKAQGLDGGSGAFSGPGARLESLVQLADVAPTILSMAGVSTDELPECDGVDLLSTSAAAGTDRRLVCNCKNEYFAVIDGRYKYLWTSIGGGELLFDVSTDPYEQTNLIHKREHQTALKTLRAELVANLAAAGSDFVADGRLKPGAGISGPRDVGRWPGFHSTDVPTDVLH